LRDFFRVPGRGAALVVLGLVVLLRAVNPTALETITLRSFDVAQQLAPRAYHPLPVRIVSIDDKSLAKYGQWPWPRTLVAKLVERIAEAHPLVLGVDVIFAEPDRTSPAKIAEAVPDLAAPLAQELRKLPPNEVALAAAFKQVPTVLAVGVSDKPEGAHGPSPVTIVRESGGDPRPFLYSTRYALRSLPELIQAARGQAVVMSNPDADGITRRVPLFVNISSQLVPILPLEMLGIAAGGGALGISTDAYGVEHGTVDGIVIPTDGRGRVYPYFSPSYELRYISAADVLDKSFEPTTLHGNIVFLGLEGQGLIDERQTPAGLMAGVEVHAQLAECIISGSLLRRPARIYWIELLLVLVAGLVAIFVLPYEKPRVAFAIFAALIIVIIGGAFTAFVYFHLLVDAFYPALASIAGFGVMLSANLRAAEAAERRLTLELDKERQIEARLEGELSAARSIQMGLLPHNFPGPPERSDLNLYALIEPARMVGGDLYDFLLLDSNRLFFAIADVSGKGVPAALFMAMTKEVLRDAVARYGEALDRAVSEANAKISASTSEMTSVGGDMMFVTVFAGILNLASGKIAYVNAGHDNPFVVRKGALPIELAGRGGPPLGTVDDFHYPVELTRLERGDLVLLYTDGVTEAENPADAFYSGARLESLLGAVQFDDAKGLVQLVRDDVHQFAAGRAEQADDITLLAVQWMSESRE